MTRLQLLDVCARIDGHPNQHELIHHHCQNVVNWNEVLQQAELEGMAPLLNKHLDESGAVCPPAVRRSLALLVKRHRTQADARRQALIEILELFQSEQLDVLVLKGAALCYTLYPDPALRPMRDIDLLVHESAADRAHAILKDGGFSQAESIIPPDHFHLPPLYRDIGDTKICIEIHRGLYPNCPPYYPDIDFDRLLAAGQSFHIGTQEACTLDDVEMLHYLYQHGFHAPLTFESYKLINGADLTGFIEKNFQTLDWQKIGERFPHLIKALPFLHQIAPWNPDNVEPKWLQPIRLEPASFEGWPHKRLKKLKAEGARLPAILQKTFLPPRWWLGIYYGAVSLSERFFCLVWKHPRHVYWWVRMYRSVK